MNNKPYVISIASAVLLTLSLGGCGGGGDDAQSSSGAGVGSGASSPPPRSAPDAFINRVMAVIANTTESAEPEDIGSVEATKPETSEPVPVS